MPHLTIEYTRNLTAFDPEMALRAANQALAASGHFAPADIKSRARCLDAWCVGVDDEPRGFIHATLSILPGRDDATQAALSDRLLQVLRQHAPPVAAHVQLCVAVEQIHGPAYAKTVLEPLALSRP